MKTLIFNGSPRENGDTQGLLDIFCKKVIGEYKIVNAYKANISPCIDCRYCTENSGCAINDGMQEVYDYIEECDNIVIASPIYFSELTGKMLDVASRLQTYFCQRVIRKNPLVSKPKKGAVILAGGGTGSVIKPYETACILLDNMNCRDIHEVVYAHNTDVKPAVENENAVRGIEDIARFFYGDKISY